MDTKKETAKGLRIYDRDQGAFAPLNARRFKKDILHTGLFVLEDGRVIEATRQRMDHWCEQFRQMRAAGIQIPFPLDHSDASKDNTGFVEAIYRNGEELICEVDVPLAEDAKRMGTTIREVSVSVKPEYQGGTGRVWRDVIRHVAPCTTPVVPGQNNFVPLDARDGDDGEYQLCQRKEGDPMDWKAIVAKAIGYDAADKSDEDVQKALETKLEGHAKQLREAKDGRDKAVATVSELREKVKDFETRVKPDEEDDDPRVIDLRKEMAALHRENAEVQADTMLREGRITPAMKQGVVELLCLRNQSVDLKEGGKKDVAGVMLGILKGLPKGAALDLSERTKFAREEENPNEEDPEKREKRLRETGKSVARSVQPEEKEDD